MKQVTTVVAEFTSAAPLVEGNQVKVEMTVDRGVKVPEGASALNGVRPPGGVRGNASRSSAVVTVDSCSSCVRMRSWAGPSQRWSRGDSSGPPDAGRLSYVWLGQRVRAPAGWWLLRVRPSWPAEPVSPSMRDRGRGWSRPGVRSLTHVTGRYAPCR